MKKKPVRKITRALAIVKSETLSLASPKDVMEFGKTLKSFIKDNHLSVKIGTSDYSMVDGWKYAGLNFGLTAIPTKPTALHKSGEYVTTLFAMREFNGKNGKYKKEIPVFVGFTHDQHIIDEMRLREKAITREMTRPYFAYECECHIKKLSDIIGPDVGRGTGFCSNLELLKSGFDEYSVISMAETRSIGKGYRNLIGYVMKAAGVEATPAEEMEGVDTQSRDPEWKMPEQPYPTQEQFNAIIRKLMTLDLKQAQKEIANYRAKHFTFDEGQETAIKITLDAKATKVPA